MAPLAKVLASNFLLMESEDLEECTTYELQLVQVSNATLHEYCDLKLNG